jgi:hypothetical protein
VDQPNDFLKRVFEHVSDLPTREFSFRHWSVPGKVTEEALGLLPLAGTDPERFIARVMDVDRYVGNIGNVVECRTVADPAFSPPSSVHFYQRVKIPLLGDVHHDLGMERLGLIQGFEVVSWRLLQRETEALSKKTGIRSQYNDGAWLVSKEVVGYTLSSTPRRDDVGFLKWKVLTTGADVAASKVIRDNIEGMARWATRP